MLFIAARFTVLQSFVNLQKKQFRQTVLLEKKKELKQVVFSEDNLFKDTKNCEWKEGNKELVLNGIYHEVVSIDKKDGNYIVTIIEDKKENELFANFFTTTNNKMQLTDCIIMILGMTFVASEPFEFKQAIPYEVKHQTHFNLKFGTEQFSCTEKPPRV